MSFFSSNSKKKEDTESHISHVKPWVEKYRPQTLDQVTAQDHAITILKKSITSGNLPHSLFYGPPGSGKTTSILALAKELYGPNLIKSRVLELNASDQRGIQIVREKVKDFAKRVVSKPSEEDLKNYPCPPYKLIILDEADSMTTDAQSALRRTMENYSKITRFCLICNYVTRIIDPLASRCSKFRFKSLDQGDSLARLKYIADEEDVKYDDDAMEKLLKCAGGDLRKAITLLQSATKLVKPAVANKDDGDDDVEMRDSPVVNKIDTNVVNEVSGTVPEDLIDNTINSCKEGVKNIRTAVDELVLAGWSAGQVVLQLHEKLILNDDSLQSLQKSKIAMALSETDAMLNDGASEHLQMLNLMLKVKSILA